MLTILFLALLLGGALLLAALVPGLGLIALVAVVVMGVLALLGVAGRGRRGAPRSPELLGPGGPDDTTS